MCYNDTTTTGVMMRKLQKQISDVCEKIQTNATKKERTELIKKLRALLIEALGEEVTDIMMESDEFKTFANA